VHNHYPESYQINVMQQAQHDGSASRHGSGTHVPVFHGTNSCLTTATSNCLPLCYETTESLRLEKTSKTMKSNHQIYNSEQLHITEMSSANNGHCAINMWCWRQKNHPEASIMGMLQI